MPVTNESKFRYCLWCLKETMHPRRIILYIQVCHWAECLVFNYHQVSSTFKLALIIYLFPWSFSLQGTCMKR